jgi:hypothetical protein
MIIYNVLALQARVLGGQGLRSKHTADFNKENVQSLPPFLGNLNGKHSETVGVFDRRDVGRYIHQMLR